MSEPDFVKWRDYLVVPVHIIPHERTHSNIMAHLRNPERELSMMVREEFKGREELLGLRETKASLPKFYLLNRPIYMLPLGILQESAIEQEKRDSFLRVISKVLEGNLYLVRIGMLTTGRILAEVSLLSNGGVISELEDGLLPGLSIIVSSRFSKFRRSRRNWYEVSRAIYDGIGNLILSLAQGGSRAFSRLPESFNILSYRRLSHGMKEFLGRLMDSVSVEIPNDYITASNFMTYLSGLGGKNGQERPNVISTLLIFPVLIVEERRRREYFKRELEALVAPIVHMKNEGVFGGFFPVPPVAFRESSTYRGIIYRSIPSPDQKVEAYLFALDAGAQRVGLIEMRFFGLPELHMLAVAHGCGVLSLLANVFVPYQTREARSGNLRSPRKRTTYFISDEDLEEMLPLLQLLGTIRHHKLSVLLQQLLELKESERLDRIRRKMWSGLSVLSAGKSPEPREIAELIKETEGLLSELSNLLKSVIAPPKASEGSTPEPLYKLSFYLTTKAMSLKDGQLKEDRIRFIFTENHMLGIIKANEFARTQMKGSGLKVIFFDASFDRDSPMLKFARMLSIPAQWAIARRSVEAIGRSGRRVLKERAQESLGDKRQPSPSAEGGAEMHIPYATFYWLGYVPHPDDVVRNADELLDPRILGRLSNIDFGNGGRASTAYYLVSMARNVLETIKGLNAEKARNIIPMLVVNKSSE